MYQHFSFQGPPKFTPVGIFGYKMNHLATLKTFRAEYNLDVHSAQGGAPIGFRTVWNKSGRMVRFACRARPSDEKEFYKKVQQRGAG
jgi:hypothetical protein